MTSRPDDNDDRPPPTKSARVRPNHRNNHSRSSLPQTRQRKAVDPRFDPMFGTATDTKQFEKNYKFLLEQQDEEEQQRRFRIRCLKCVLRRHELEEARQATRWEEEAVSGGKHKKKKSKSAEEEEEDGDLSDYEHEVFGGEHQQDLHRMKLTPPQHLYRELEQLQRECQLYVSRRKNGVALSRKDQVRKDIMKKEVRAVRDGAKAKPFFPKRSAVKRAVLSDKFDKLEEKGGKDAVDSYLARKVMRN